jgi:2-polyprenyl-3-methyl-5-hydroxy-6-metoxy-1,4-benzoquinol methylase
VTAGSALSELRDTARLGPRESLAWEAPVTDNAQTPSLADRFDSRYSVLLRSATWQHVHRTAFGDDYPEDTNSNGFYSRTTLQHLCTALRLTPGRTLADLGCGHGGPGLWVARQTGANLIGIDISAVGVAVANQQALRFGLADLARFQVGDLTATGWTAASCDAVLSLDVLIFVPDKAAAVHEFARILRTGGRLGFTTWEQSGYSTRLGAEQLTDHRPLLEATGFTIEAYQEPAGWRQQQRAVAEGLVAAEPELAREMDAATGTELAAMARGVLADMAVRRYIRVVAQKR